MIFAGSRLIFLGLIFSSLCGWGQIFKPIKDWRYVPAREEFWNVYQDLVLGNNYSDALDLIVDSIQDGAAGNELSEAKVALSDLCLKIGNVGCSYVSAYEVIRDNPTSNQTAQALVILQELVQKYAVDEEEISRLINSAVFSQVPPEVFSMVNYYSASDNLAKNLNRWAMESAQKMDLKSFWGLRIGYLNILSQLNSLPVEKIIEQLNALQIEIVKFPKFQSEVALQKARLLFEIKKFEEADEIYKNNSYLGRDYGQVLLEKAWIKYYQRDYSVTLGMLESLKAPFFQVAVNPEQYILAMIAYRDLCHYPSVAEVAKDFRVAFAQSIENIKSRKPLAKDANLMRLVLQQNDLQPLADLVSHLNRERLSPNELFSKYHSKLSWLWNAMQNYELELRGRIEFRVRDRLKMAAENLLAVAEQVKLVEYVSSLDEFRLKQIYEKRTYKSEEIEHYAIDRLYWPVKKEFWWEEMSNYQIRIADRCTAGGK